MSDEQDFVVEGEQTNDTDQYKKIRVYDDRGDFFIEVPPGCRMTFGYFNPKPHADTDPHGYNRGRPSEVARATALRIYQDSTDKRQLACFLGVKGFRDETIKLTRIIQKVTVESRLVDDGEGTVEYGGKQMRELTAAPESEF